MNKSFDFSSHPSFQKIQDLVRNQMCQTLAVDWPTAIEMMSKGKVVDLRSNYEFMLQIENCLLDLLLPYFQKETFQSLQFPVNLRALCGEATKDYLQRPFATDYLHCDVWSGAPADSINFFFYIFTKGNCSHLKIYQTIKDDPYASQFRGPYSEFKSDPSTLKEVAAEVKAGMMHIFDTFCPHQTIRTGEGLRISMDFRVRIDTPYRIDGTAADAKRFGCYSPGSPGPGIYWSMPVAQSKDFKSKCDFELRKAAELGSWAHDLRRDYIRYMIEVGLFGKN